MTIPLIERLRALHEQATPGPWEKGNGPAGKPLLFSQTVDYGESGEPENLESAANLALTCAMRNALPALLDRLAEPPPDRAMVIRDAVAALTREQVNALAQDFHEDFRVVLLRYLLGEAP